MNKRNIPYFVIVFSLFLGVSAPALFSDGMFMDGLIYATVAKNLANGIGTFWYLQFSETLFPAFHEHPPLAIAMQSVFFKTFGNSIYIERFYSLFTFVITGFIIFFIWKQIAGKKNTSLACLPLFFWISIPLTTWSCANNMLENTLMIFTSLSILFALKSIDKNQFLYIFLSGIMLFLAFLTKGFVALFPWSVYFWLWIFTHKVSFKKFIQNTFLLVLFTLIPFLFIYIFQKEGIDSLMTYFNKQVLGSIQNKQTVDSRFFIIGKMFKEILIPLILVGVGILVYRLKNKRLIFLKENSSNALFFMALALSGVLPIMISMKQNGFYINPVFPLLSIAFALLIVQIVKPPFEKWLADKKIHTIISGIAGMLLLASIIISVLQVNKIGRDKDKLQDVYTLIEIIPHKTTINISEDLAQDWALHGYFARHANISLNHKKKAFYDYLLSSKPDINIAEYQPIDVDLKKYFLYKNLEFEKQSDQ